MEVHLNYDFVAYTIFVIFIIKNMKNSKYTKEILEIAVKDSKTMSDVVRKITGKTKVHGSMSAYIKTLVKYHDIDIKHFLGSRWCLDKINPTGIGRTKEEFMKRFLNIDSPYISTHALKRKLINFKLLEYKCSNKKCNIVDEWNGEKIVLQLDHTNGLNTDNRLINLRLLCPNCHSQTETYAGKNNLNKK